MNSAENPQNPEILKKLRIGVDFDEVLADFNRCLFEFRNKEFGTSFSREDLKSYHYEHLWDISTEETRSYVHNYYLTDDFMCIPPIEGAQEAIKDLASKHTLIGITSRPQNIEDKTREWLELHFPQQIGDIYFTNTYSLDGSARKKTKAEICTELGVELMIEDSFENAIACAEAGIPVLLLDCPWNQDELPPNVFRVYNWTEIINYINLMSL